MSGREDLARLIGPLAAHFWGEHNAKLSNERKGEYRYGTHGARSVSTSKGTFYDNEAKEGGGALDLVRRETGLQGREAFEWLREHGFEVEDERRPTPASNGKDHERERPREKPKIVATYDYTDESGDVLFQVCRFEPKTFRQRKPKGGDAWEWNVKGVRVVPYRLRELQEAISQGEDVFIVEGEKDVDRLISEGINATCNPGGAGKWPADFAQYFEAAHRVIILPDNDEAGRNHCNVVGRSLKATVEKLGVLEIPGLEDKEDVSDYYDRGGTTEELFEILKAKARPWSAEAPASTFGAIKWEDLDNPGEELEYVIDGLYTRGDLSVTAGPSQSGKSFFMIHAGLVVAINASPLKDKVPDFFGFPIATGGLVVYFAGEASRGVKNRLRAFRKHYGIDPKAHIPFVVLTKRLDLLRGSQDGRPSDTDRLIAECKAWQAYYDLPLAMVVVDTLATATAGADENSAKDMTTVFSNCGRLKDETGAHVALVHHMNKHGGHIRGHSSIYANSDQVVLVVKDDGETGIRTAKVDKQKDDSGGLIIKFGLKVIDLGVTTKTGRKISSCVVLDEGVEREDDQAEKGRGKGGEYVPGDTERPFLLALFETLRKAGKVPQPDWEIPVSIAMVAAWEDVRGRFAKRIWIDEKDKKAEDARVRQAAKRAGAVLLRVGVIGKSGNHIWHTGRPIKGIRESVNSPSLAVPSMISASYSEDGSPIKEAEVIPPDDQDEIKDYLKDFK